MNYEILQGHSSKVLRELSKSGRFKESIDCLVTSPPYFQKRYYLENTDPLSKMEIGREGETNSYFQNLKDVFLEARGLLKRSATVFVNLGDTFRDGQALSIPFGFKDSMKSVGYHFIQEIVWAKSITLKTGNVGSCKPESVTKRFTVSHEYVLFFVKDLKEYFFDQKGVAVPINGISHENQNPSSLLKSMGATEHSLLESKSLKDYSLTNAEDPTSVKNRIIRNKIANRDFTAHRRSVWQIQTPNSRKRHTAVGPLELFENCILAGSPKGGIVLDPFAGEGTTGIAALKNDRKFIGIDLDSRSCREARENLESFQKRRAS
ncbi:DNA-methyltransferase [Leptospira sanjuanensis]|uniref:DNA-methyltransferase n=1 Tax=Leptospira sanjuanensis TaxID=2879643 RepID=UPI001EE86339|nr:site-specific DNA-methyltransferase [Leptospira sanjuanensis]MCG6170255.1 site-specific DNA-methyltransferase [Leptospira sanjuanensis]